MNIEYLLAGIFTTVVIIIYVIVFVGGDIKALLTGEYASENPYKWKIVKNTLKNGIVEYEVIRCNRWGWTLVPPDQKTLEHCENFLALHRKEWDDKQGRQVVKQEILK